MVSENTDGDEVVISRRSVDRDVSVNEYSVRIPVDELGVDPDKFRDDLNDRMDREGADKTSSGGDSGSSGVVDDAVSQFVEEQSSDTDAEKEPSPSNDSSPEDEDEEDIPEPDETSPSGEESTTLDEFSAEDEGGGGAPELTAEEAAEEWDTSGRESFNSDCLSADPEPQLGMAECASLWSEIKDAGLANITTDTDAGSGGSDANAEDSSGNDGGEMAEALGSDIPAEDVDGAYLVIEGGTDSGEKSREQFSKYIENGSLKVAEYFNSPVAKDIRESLDGGMETPELVLETEDGYHVV
jgi:hypothetical protein